MSFRDSPTLHLLRHRMVVCGGLASFYMAWGIGANDVANSFATSVGSKTLKLWQACIVSLDLLAEHP